MSLKRKSCGRGTQLISHFRRIVRSILQDKLEVRSIIEASDGVEAIELVQALQPDLILLDIGLPKLNGIKAARRIRELAPRSKILFVSQESSVDIVQAAFSTGARATWLRWMRDANYQPP